MKILHIAYSLSESSSATRLAKEQAKRHEIFFLLGRLSNDDFVRSRQIHPHLSCIFGVTFHIAHKFYGWLYGLNRHEVFTIDFWVGFKKIIFKALSCGNSFDLLHLHWGGLGFFPLEVLQAFGGNSIITAHDYQFFTGGCHIPMDCEEYEMGCINCPLVEGNKIKKIIRNRRKKIKEGIKFLNLSVIAPSNYTKNKISSVFPAHRISVIPSTYGEYWGVHQDLMLNQSVVDRLEKGPVLLTVGLKREPRDNKGFEFVRSMILGLKQNNINFQYISIGAFDNQLMLENHLHYDCLDERKLSHQYRKADLCIVGSKFETFSQVTLESVVYGTPVIAFNIGGPAEIIENKVTGFLIEPFEGDKFFQLLQKKLTYKNTLKVNSGGGAERAKEKYSPSNIGEAVDMHYLKFSKEI